MVPQRKILAVQNLAEKLKLAKALILTDYSGLKVSQINALRREIKKTGGEFGVVKNTLLRLAAKNSPIVELSNCELTKPTAALWLYSEDVAPLKILDNFIKKIELPKIKFGFWQGETISLERIKELANLPGIMELKTKLVGLLQSPISGLVNVLNSNIRKLVIVLGTASALRASAVEGGEH